MENTERVIKASVFHVNNLLGRLCGIVEVSSDDERITVLALANVGNLGFNIGRSVVVLVRFLVCVFKYKKRHEGGTHQLFRTLLP